MIESPCRSIFHCECQQFAKRGATARVFVLLLVVWMVLLWATSAVAQPAGFNYDESLVPNDALPQLLRCEDGSKISTAEDWLGQRRAEVFELIQNHVYGQRPSWQPVLRIRERSRNDSAVDGLAIRRELTVFFTDDDTGPGMELLVYTPKAATQPVPGFIGYNFHGNHSIEDDESIFITQQWVRNDTKRGNVNHKATAKSRGRSQSRWPLKMILERGYSLTTLYCGDIDPDFDDTFRNGIHAVCEDRVEGQPRSSEAGGTISAWSWGLSRALDVLALDPLVDGDRMAVFGHSRLGKTSLWAGASDQRFAMVISNNSGCGGAALSRRAFGETVKRINTSFPHWFCRQFREYNDNESACPVDQHMLLALVAPRPVYVASAEGDRWADPRGEMLSLFHASPVYQLFGKTGLRTDELPAIDHPIHLDVGYHIRSGGHDVKDFDWQQYLTFADQHLK
ncbi:MAG: acetylxylan esterase [Fuerstiella sp.]